MISIIFKNFRSNGFLLLFFIFSFLFLDAYASIWHSDPIEDFNKTSNQLTFSNLDPSTIKTAIINSDFKTLDLYPAYCYLL